MAHQVRIHPLPANFLRHSGWETAKRCFYLTTSNVMYLWQNQNLMRVNLTTAKTAATSYSSHIDKTL